MPNGSNDKKRKTIGVIGAGAMGIAAALEIRRQFTDLYDVEIYEAHGDILLGSSGGTPGRMGFGYHYADLETALKYLEYTIGFIRRFPESIRDDNLEGQYFITHDSLVDPGYLLQIYSKISQSYNEIARTDPDIMKIFGGQLMSHRFLTRDQYKDHVSSEKVNIAVATLEKIFDIESFKSQVKDELSSLGVKIYYNTKVSRIISTDGGFKLQIQMVGKKRKNCEDQLAYVDVFNVDQIIECTWNNSERIIARFATDNNLKPPDIQAFSSRLKFLAEVRIPEDIARMNHSFFCVGPFAMFTNESSEDKDMLQNIAKITYANVTNVLGCDQMAECQDQKRIALWQDIYKRIGNISIAEWYKMVDNDSITEEMAQIIGTEIIKGVAEYIPQMNKATLIRLLPGYVLSSQEGKSDISAIDSKIHKRSEGGINKVAEGFWSAKAMKLFGCVKIAEQLMLEQFPDESRERKLKLDSEARYKELIAKAKMIFDLSIVDDKSVAIKPTMIKRLQKAFDRGCQYSETLSRVPSSCSSSQGSSSNVDQPTSPSLFPMVLSSAGLLDRSDGISAGPSVG
jgi:hypothetical protein